MTKLTDTQAILLSTAAQRTNGSLLPLPATLKRGGGASKALTALIKHGFAEERRSSDPDLVYRTDGEERYGLFITTAGSNAIGVTFPEATNDAGEDQRSVPPASTGKAPPKSTLVLGLLRQPSGATLAELIALTGWLPHTTRAALTGLRKKGHDVTRGKRDGVTFYMVAAK